MRKALITGITGQDGSYLAEFLFHHGYEVHGIVRRSSAQTNARLTHLPAGAVRCHYADLADGTALSRLIHEIEPDEVYNLAAQSDVAVSFNQPEYTADVVATGALRLFEALATFASKTGKHVRVYQAGSSEMFGSSKPPQNEQTRFHPRSPYAASKVAAHWFAVNYRESGRFFVSNGILFNHESPRRGENFVTRKITRAVGRILVGLQSELALGNLDAKRDWGFAGDYVEGMWLMLQHSKPDDFVLSTGESHSVAEFVAIAFSRVGLEWEKYVRTDPALYRPTEVDFLQGDSSKARRVLEWQPRTSFHELVGLMVDADVRLAEHEAACSRDLPFAKNIVALS